MRERWCFQSAAWALAGYGFCELLGVLCLNNRGCEVQAVCPYRRCAAFRVFSGDNFSGAVVAGKAQASSEQSTGSTAATNAPMLSGGVERVAG